MADSVSHGPSFNSCLFHLQKLELELKCPLCLNLLKRPMLLPCDHLFCSSCISSSADDSLSCPICTLPLHTRELRLASHMETMVNIYKSMSAAFNTNFGLPRGEVNSSDVKRSANKEHNYGEKIVEEKPSRSRDGIQADQAQCSPPSSAGLKYSDDDSNDRTSDPRSDQCREQKKIKLNNEPCRDEMSTGSEQHLVHREFADHGVINMTPSSQNNKFPCAFCHSSKESEASGPMMHYLNGEPVDGVNTANPHTLHVHQKCIEWAPQVFFVEDNAKNLEAEISRASKIKCTICGKKGAALGCYSKSCRKSFHVPCAVDLEGCRWDCDNFLLLCPSHADRKLPIDKPNRKMKPKIGGYQSANDSETLGQDKEEVWLYPKESTRGWVLCGSALSAGEKESLIRFSSLTGAAWTKDWRPSVTHVVASTDPSGACSRTLKFLMAILSGKWIVSMDWIKACLDAGHPVAESSFEISHDIHGSFDGPRNGRARVLQQAPKLFSGWSFYFAGNFMPTYKGYLKDLIFAAGGDLVEETTRMPKSTGLVVYSVDPPAEVNSSDAEGVMNRRLQEAKALAVAIGAKVVPHTWILDSIAACKVQPFSH